MTGCREPEAAARWVLSRPGCRTQWAVVKLGGKGALLALREGDGSEPRFVTVPVPCEVRAVECARAHDCHTASRAKTPTPC